MDMHFNDQVALVTGAGSGLGNAAAKMLAQAGVRVGVLSRTAEEVEKTAQEIRQAGGQAISLVADISDAKKMENAIEKLVGEWGRLDIVFANAGINGVWAPIEDLALDEWEKTLRINLTGTFITIKYSVPHMKKNGGSIIVTSSVNGTRKFSNSGATAYSTTKAGQVAMTKMLALELAKHRIRVNVICPGAIESQIGENTEQRNLKDAREPVEYQEGSQIPLTDGKPGKSEDVGNLVLFLASDASRHITGTEIWIDGGETLIQG